MLREFQDTDGITWRVWDVHPVLHAQTRTPSLVPPGWLCFESSRGRRRLSPIPTAWESCDELSLCALCASAESVQLLARDRR
jgi:hypothetical protein